MTCIQCAEQFTITDSDRAFYAKLSVPEPRLCPDCRRRRRFAFRNERALYTRVCDLCKKPTVSFYSAAYSGPVYCQPCWWSDSWDPFSYAREYDEARPFFDQLKELFRAVPLPSLISRNSENSEFTAHSFNNKNCYVLISSGYNEECYYGLQIVESQNVMDAVFARGCMRGYELVDCEKMYNSMWCQKSNNCTDSSFLYDCHGCMNCFFSVNLRNQQYVFRNQQLSKEEYEKRMAEIVLGSDEAITNFKKEFRHYVCDRAIHRYTTQTKCEESTGNYLLSCKNAKECFDARNLEDCKYIVVSPGPTKDSYDINYCAMGVELFCDVLSNVDSAMNQQYCQYSWASAYLQYCSYVMNSDFCFGSQGLRKAKFCILNKQYSEDEYHQRRTQIISDMTAREEYGQFFLPSLSAFGYNETEAHDEWPLSKEQALAQGFNWSDAVAGKYGTPTKERTAIPDDIAEIDTSILKEILACVVCGKNYKIIAQEFEFYKKMRVPLPRKCFDCRHLARMKLRNPRKLWYRQCMCDNAEHGHRAEAAGESGFRCSIEFETSYTPDRPEKVFCEKCYQQEVV